MCGFADHCGDNTPSHACVSAAPEIILGEKYTIAVDMWSLGVITYILLCGYPPFEGATVMRMYREIRNAHYEFHPEHWSKISSAAKDFIRRLLVVDAGERMTAQQALRHEWYAPLACWKKAAAFLHSTRE